METKQKIWVYQSIRNLNSTEIKSISDTIFQFLSNWEAHGVPLQASFDILKEKFIIIKVEENNSTATGCSIDKLTQLMKRIDTKFQLELLNRTWVSFEKDHQIMTYPLAEFKAMIKNNILTKDTNVYNLSVATNKEFDAHFIAPLEKSWAKIFLNN